MHKKANLILVLVILLALGAGAVSPAKTSAAQLHQDDTSSCDHASTFLVGRLAELPRVRGLIHDLCDFRVQMDQVDRNNTSRFDRRFIEHAIAGNMIEIQTLEYTLERVSEPELRGLIQMMIAMHEADLQMALEVAKEIGADRTPDLTNMRVYPKTPEYDLGIRRINLVARFIDPLMTVGGGTQTPTAIPTTATVPTGTGTGVPGTQTPTPVVTGTITSAVSPTGTGTAVGTGTVTAGPTGTGTGTVTAGPTGTGTAIGTGTTTPMMTGTVPATGTGTSVGTGTVTPLVTSTGTMMTTPTAPPTNIPGFARLAAEIIEDEHVMHIEVALVAQRLAENSEIRAFAKHAADVAKLHMLLLDDLKYRLFYHVTLPPPDFTAEYQSPRKLEAAGEDE